MPVEILARFLEHQTFPDRDTGLAPGYKPARIDVGHGEKRGHILDLKALRHGQQVSTVIFETHFAVGEEPVDLAYLLREDPGASLWLETVRGRYESFLPEVKIESLSFRPMFYTRYLGEERQRSFIVEQPPVALYAKVLPCVTDREGNLLQPLYYRRMVTDAKGNTTTYSLRLNDEDLEQLPGVLLGELHLFDFDGLNIYQADEFPLQQYLTVSYPVPIRDAHQINPLSLEIQLAPTDEIITRAREAEKMVNEYSKATQE